jgi:hypothetical protein
LRFLSSVVPFSSVQAAVFGLACVFALGVGPAAGAPSDASHQRRATTVQKRVKQPTLQRVDGGPGYHGRFSNALPARPSFFPIAVWFASATLQADINKDKDAGLNTYVVLTRNSNLSLLRRNGMKTVLQHEQWRPDAGQGPETVGWELHDEIDMQMSPSEGHATLQRMLSSLPADKRMRYNNFGKGVIFWESDAEARQYVNAVDIRSADIYWFTDPNVCGSSEGGHMLAKDRQLPEAECRRASNYGATVQRMRRLVTPHGSSPVWNFVELGHPFSENDAPTITPLQVKAAVWHSLIAGARGIVYFNHSFAGGCESDNILRESCYADVRGMVRTVNRQVRSLARVLNAPTLVSGWRHSSTTKAMAKWSGRHFYVFAGSARNTASTASFSIGCLGSAKAAVLGENRTIPVRRGSFSDSFAHGNAIHIYRIDRSGGCRPTLRKSGSG